MAESELTHKEEGEEPEEGEISDEDPVPHSPQSEEQVESFTKVEADEVVEQPPAETAAVVVSPPPNEPSSRDADPTPTVLRRRIGLDELIELGSSSSELRKASVQQQVRKRDPYAGRAGRDLDPSNEDDGKSVKRNDWGAYGANLYNFAWAQAVSGRPSSFGSTGDSPSISPSARVSIDGLSSSGSGGLGSWSREYNRDLDYARSVGRSSEERDDMSPLRENGSRPTERISSERDPISKGRRIIRETSWSGRTERFVTVKNRIDRKSEREGGGLSDVDDYHRGQSDGEEGRWGKQRSESHSPNGRLNEAEESRGRSPSEAKLQARQNGKENDETDGREEGELEEGEIELPVGSLPPEKSTSPPKDPPNSTRQNKYSAVKAGDYWPKDKNYTRSLSSKSQSRSQIEDYSSRRHRQIKPQETQREKRLVFAGELVKNVTVKDAQKSFVDVCGRLHKALRVLDELHTPSPTPRLVGFQDERQEAFTREVSALARQAFAGIRAVHAVRNTASGREQERDKNVFPRLLELANGYCQKLFTPKQTRELEEMTQTIANAGRQVRDSSAEKGQYAREYQSQLASKKSNDNDAKTANSLGDNILGNAKSSATTETNTSAGSIGGRILGNTIVHAKEAEEAAKIAADALAYAKRSAAARPNSSSASIYDSRPSGTSFQGRGQWVWPMSETQPQMQFSDPRVTTLQSISNLYNLPKAKYDPWNNTEQRTIKQSQEGIGVHFVVEAKAYETPAPGNAGPQATNQDFSAQPGYRKPAPLGILEEEWEELSPPGAGTSSYGRSEATPAQSDSVQGKLWPSKPDTVPVVTYQTSRGIAPPTYPPELFLDLNQQRNRVNANIYNLERLPSPTPDEEEEDASVGPALPSLESKPGLLDLGSKEASALAQAQGVGNLPSAMPLSASVQQLNRSHSLDATAAVMDPRTQKDKSGDFSLLSATRALEHSESAKIPNSATMKVPFRSRDPRRRFQNNSVDLTDAGAMDLNSQLIPGPNLSLGEESDSSKRRLGPDLDDKEDTRMPKRLKGESDSTVAFNDFPVENSHGAAGSSGGWLDDNVVSSFGPIEDLAVAMEVDDEGQFTAFEGKNGLGSDVQTGESGSRKMKPRDPRRVFLESHVERDDGFLVDNLKIDGMATVAPRNDELGQVVRATPEVSTWNDKETIQASKQGASFTNNATSEQLGNAHGVTSPVPDGRNVNDPNDGEVNPISNDLISQDFADLQKEKATAANVGSRKVKGISTQWGASQVHPHLEQLLGDLSEEERRSVQMERQRRMEEQDRMFKAGKLCLVLDLDHTLLNSAKFAEIEPEWDQRLRVAETAERNRTGRDGVERRELYRFPHMSMWTKLRPGIWKFLAKASQLYELHVYTMGNKVYATEMAKLLDPTGKLFAGRVISKGDDGDGDDLLPKSKDLDGVLGMESAVIIIDDSARVWPHHSENLIVVERYMYFPCSRRQFGLAGPSLLEVGHDERESDGMLASALGVIENIHQSFFKNPRWREIDVREILAEQQRGVLLGCKVVFSRVFPVGEAEPHRHPLWRTAEQFGAICTIALDEEVTHVVAISLGTDKVNWALETGRHVVRPAWLEASTILYRKAHERDFPVLPQ